MPYTLSRVKCTMKKYIVYIHIRRWMQYLVFDDTVPTHNNKKQR